MFSNGMIESQSGEVLLDHSDPDSLLKLLRYMYTGSIEMTSTSALPLLSLANRFGIHLLKDHCEQFITREISVENCSLFLSAADRFNCSELRQLCIDFVLRNFELVAETKHFLGLAPECLLDIVRSDELLISSEERLFQVLKRWLSHDEKQRNHLLSELLMHVRFPLMRSNFLIDQVEKSETIMASPAMKDLLFEAYRFHAVSEQFREQSERTRERGIYPRVCKC
jgi:hypothetical protein